MSPLHGRYHREHMICHDVVHLRIKVRACSVLSHSVSIGPLSPQHSENSHVKRDHTVLPDTRQRRRSHHNTSQRWYSINQPRRYERLSCFTYTVVQNVMETSADRTSPKRLDNRTYYSRSTFTHTVVRGITSQSANVFSNMFHRHFRRSSTV